MAFPGDITVCFRGFYASMYELSLTTTSEKLLSVDFSTSQYRNFAFCHARTVKSNHLLVVS
jgi:hypothetical protein